MGLGVLSNLSQWNPQQMHVERDMDSSAYEAAHPDDTLLLAGPPRYKQVASSGAVPATTDAATLLPIGNVQQISFQQSKPTQPLMAVGSGRSFFTSGKAQTGWNAARLWLDAANLLRTLYNYGVKKAGIGASTFDDPAAVAAAADGNTEYYFNLDSELFYMPFGMLCLFRDKVHDHLGSFYVEMCMIASWGVQVGAGQSQIVENVSGVADRILPVPFVEIPTGAYANRKAAAAVVGLTAPGSDSDALTTNDADLPRTVTVS